MSFFTTNTLINEAARHHMMSMSEIFEVSAIGIRLHEPRRVNLQPMDPAHYLLTIDPARVYFFNAFESIEDDGESAFGDDFSSDEEDEHDPLPIPSLNVPADIPDDFFCSICRGRERVGVVSHPCLAHLFHSDCLVGWLKRNPECPLCRRVHPDTPPPKINK